MQNSSDITIVRFYKETQVSSLDSIFNVFTNHVIQTTLKEMFEIIFAFIHN